MVDQFWDIVSWMVEQDNLSEKSKPLCLITGVGDGTGSALVARFSKNYIVAMIARNPDRLRKLSQRHDDCHAFPCDLANLDALADTLDQIKKQLGPVKVLIHNAVAHTFGTFLDEDPAELEKNFRVNTTALLHLARYVSPNMIADGGGSIMVTGNTASYRGVANYALFAPTKSAQRILCEALARDLGPKRVHVGYVSMDGAIDVTWIEEADGENPKWLDPPEDWPHPREDYFISTAAIADEVYHMAHQHRTAWSFETTIRPFAENW